jgi:hypothetical protein
VNKQPRLIQTFLLDGTLEGAQIIEFDSTVKAFAVPRLKLSDVKSRVELFQPALYFLINASDNKAYIGESENFYERVKEHTKSKDWWDLAVAIVSTTNTLEKSDVKYLESLAVERAQGGSVVIENKTAPIRNNIHEFKLHTLQRILDDTQFVLTSLGYDILSSPKNTHEQVWYCRAKLTDARAVFRGEQFVVLAGSKLDTSHAPSFEKDWPGQVVKRQELFKSSSIDHGNFVELTENVAFKSPNSAGGIVTGRSINAWTTWKNEAGQTMDEVMRKGE